MTDDGRQKQTGKVLRVETLQGWRYYGLCVADDGEFLTIHDRVTNREVFLRWTTVARMEAQR